MPAYDPAGARAPAGAGRLRKRQGPRPDLVHRQRRRLRQRRSSRCSSRTSASRSTTRRWTSQTYQARLATDPPRMWSISWVADYPGPNDFLGVLLGHRVDRQPGRLVDRPSSTPRSRTRRRPPTRRRRDRGVCPRDGASSATRPRPSRSATGRRSRSSATGCSARARTASASSGSPASPGRTGDDGDCGCRRRAARHRPRVRRPAASGPAGGCPRPTRSRSASRTPTTGLRHSRSRSRSPVTRSVPLERAELRLRFPDTLGPRDRRRPGPQGTGTDAAAVRPRRHRRRPHRAQHDRSPRRGPRTRRPARRRSCRPTTRAVRRTRRTTGGRSRAT